MASTQLFPPIVNYVMPAFDYNTESIKVYFNLSQYNNSTDFGVVYGSVRYQNDNTIAVKTVGSAGETYYPMGIIQFEPKVTDNELDRIRYGQFYVQLERTMLTDGFQKNRLLKMQLCLSSVGLSDATNLTAGWFQSNAYQLNSSEWSTVTVLNPIDPPIARLLRVTNPDKPEQDILNAENAYTKNIAAQWDINVSEFLIHYTPKDSKQGIKEWKIEIYNEAEVDPVFKDDNIELDLVKYKGFDNTNLLKYNEGIALVSKTGIVNQEDYVISEVTTSQQFAIQSDFNFEENKYYFVIVTLTTSSNYEINLGGFLYGLNAGEDKLNLNQSVINGRTADFTVKTNMDLGCVDVILKPQSTAAKTLGVILRRTEYKQNKMKIWTDIACKTFINQSVEWVYHDFTIESGTVYQYAVQTIDAFRNRGKQIIAEPAYIDLQFETAFLMEDENTILPIPYDFQVSSMQKTIYEQKFETIGSPYPIVLRNGEINYRTLSISGLITKESNKYEVSFFDDEWADGTYHSVWSAEKNYDFITDEELYQRGEELRGRYNIRRGYLDHDKDREDLSRYDIAYDHYLERNYRNKVWEFLTNEKPKLLKTLPEGNILVKIDASNVSLSPKQELGRLIWEFSATAYEIGLPTLKNLMSFGLITTPIIQMDTSQTWSKQDFYTLDIDIIKDLGFSDKIVTRSGSRYVKTGTDLMPIIKKQLNVNEDTDNNSFYISKIALKFAGYAGTAGTESDIYTYKIQIPNSPTEEPRVVQGMATIPADAVDGHIIDVKGKKIAINVNTSTGNAENIYELGNEQHQNAHVLDMDIHNLSLGYDEKDLIVEYYASIQTIPGSARGTVKSYTYQSFSDTPSFRSVTADQDLISLIKSSNITSDDIRRTKTYLSKIYSIHLEAEAGSKVTFIFSSTQQPTTIIIPAEGFYNINPHTTNVSITSLKIDTSAQSSHTVLANYEGLMTTEWLV